MSLGLDGRGGEHDKADLSLGLGGEGAKERKHGGANVSIGLGGRGGEHGEADLSLGLGDKGCKEGKRGRAGLSLGLGGRGGEHGEADLSRVLGGKGSKGGKGGSTDVPLLSFFRPAAAKEADRGLTSPGGQGGGRAGVKSGQRGRGRDSSPQMSAGSADVECATESAAAKAAAMSAPRPPRSSVLANKVATPAVDDAGAPSLELLGCGGVAAVRGLSPSRRPSHNDWDMLKGFSFDHRNHVMETVLETQAEQDDDDDVDDDDAVGETGKMGKQAVASTEHDAVTWAAASTTSLGTSPYEGAATVVALVALATTKAAEAPAALSANVGAGASSDERARTSEISDPPKLSRSILQGSAPEGAAVAPTPLPMPGAPTKDATTDLQV